MLQAAVVARLRKEIADLREQLQAELGITGGAPHGASSAAAVGLAAEFPTAAASVVDSAVAAASANTAGVSALKVVNALKLVEAQLSVSRQVAQAVGLAQLSPEEQQELLRVQDENTFLK